MFFLSVCMSAGTHRSREYQSALRLKLGMIVSCLTGVKPGNPEEECVPLTPGAAPAHTAGLLCFVYAVIKILGEKQERKCNGLIVISLYVQLTRGRLGDWFFANLTQAKLILKEGTSTQNVSVRPACRQI